MYKENINKEINNLFNKTLIIEDMGDIFFIEKNIIIGNNKIDNILLGTFYNNIGNIELIQNADQVIFLLDKIFNIHKECNIIFSVPFVKDSLINSLLENEHKNIIKIKNFIKKFIKEKKIKIQFLINNFIDISKIIKLYDILKVKEQNVIEIILGPMYFFVNYDYLNLKGFDNEEERNNELKLFFEGIKKEIIFLNNFLNKNFKEYSFNIIGTNLQFSHIAFYYGLNFFQNKTSSQILKKVENIRKKFFNNYKIFIYSKKNILTITDRYFMLFNNDISTRISNKKIYRNLITKIKEEKQKIKIQGNFNANIFKNIKDDVKITSYIKDIYEYFLIN